jgi:hypothetical protein
LQFGITDKACCFGLLGLRLGVQIWKDFKLRFGCPIVESQGSREESIKPSWTPEALNQQPPTYSRLACFQTRSSDLPANLVPSIGALVSRSW